MHVCRCFPHDDGAFAAFVAECEALLPETHRGSPRALERLVRVRYPAAVVRPQTDLAASRSMRIWYVYRDGSAMPASSQLQSSSQ